MQRVVDCLLAEAKEARRGLARSAPEARIDLRTTDPALVAQDGRLVHATARTRGLLLREAMLCLRLLSPKAPEGAEALTVFLEDPHDGLVVETLEAFAGWRLDASLPALLALHRTCPAEGGLRPEVVRALRSCLFAITGRRFETSDDLARWLETTAGRRSAA